MRCLVVVDELDDKGVFAAAVLCDLEKLGDALEARAPRHGKRDLRAIRESALIASWIAGSRQACRGARAQLHLCVPRTDCLKPGRARVEPD